MEVWWTIQILPVLPFLALLRLSSCSSAGQHQNDLEPTELVSRIEYFEVGKDANLTCASRTWSGALYYIWKINISGVHCLISESKKNPPHNNCTGGKMLRNSTKGTSYLSIPLFGPKDEGTYKCEVAYIGGADTTIITVLAAVPPVLSIRLEQCGGQRFAVCSAAGGKPVATVSWRETWGSAEVTERSTLSVDGTVTMESWLLVPNNITMDQLICVANHLSWTQGNSVAINLTEISDGSSAGELQHIIILSSFVVLSMVIVTAFSTYMCL